MMPEKIHIVPKAAPEKSPEEQLQIAYDRAFDELYTGEELDKLMERLKDDLYRIVSLSFQAGYRAAGGSLPAHP